MTDDVEGSELRVRDFDTDETGRRDASRGIGTRERVAPWRLRGRLAVTSELMDLLNASAMTCGRGSHVIDRNFPHAYMACASPRSLAGEGGAE